ncbi:MAG: hypothetical protein NZ518_05180 [Dehalococcoidia bacterium]|nr:hypothetical protein [Dehalococcoidia bacterium]
MPIDTRPKPPPPCALCGGPVLDHACKLRCLRCGFTRDCSDP